MRGTEQKTTLELKLEKLRSICEKSPDNHIGLLALAETAFRRGLRLEALEAYQKVLKDESVAEAHLCMAQMYRHHGLFQEAISELRVLFEMEPGYPEAHVFARELSASTALPQDIEEILLAGCGNDELALARVRLSIARSLVLREGQELVAIQDANAGDPTFGYYIFETRKRLSYCEEVLSQLTVLEDARKAYLADLDRQRQIERERLRAAENPVVETSDPVGPIAQPSLVEPLEGVSDYIPAGETGAADFEPTKEVEWVEHEVLQAEPDVVHVQAEVSDPQEFLEESVVEQHSSSEEQAKSVEPALWDDHPVLVAPTHDSGEVEPHEVHQDLSFDITPVLEGSLPPETEEVESLEDESSYEELPVAHPALGLGLSTESGLGDDLNPPVQAHEDYLILEREDSISQPVEAELEPEPVVELSAVEPVAEPILEVRDFPSLYAPLLASLEGLIQTLAKTRSVSSVFLLNREGYAVAEQVKDSIAKERLSEFIIETVAFLEAFANAPQYWVLECAGGIVVIQSVDSYHYLVTIGQTGANFGALRYTMDRVRPNFEQVLQPACPA